ncbi:hypothetical protein B0J12DRAFT_719394 [Macrophomina phaseolina]|uniref:gamma-glutamylcyclotransferase n=1 Tax=Macrophomina phaseolina TaxID=35725 RepID=A0ABQ8G8C2_9PEZI|nr:hypothetical protein B0J12DRAFT_719394 [Macrophomina phaseolina]
MASIRPDTVWYFAYGSNMSSSTFRGSRGIEPLAEVAAKIPGWTLTFEIYGMPYKEPGYASIVPVSSAVGCSEKAPPEVYGVAYLVTREQYISILASEAGDIVYNTAELPAQPLNPDDDVVALLGDAARGAPALRVATLVSGFACSPSRLPSSRYKGIMVQGGAEASLPDAYQAYLDHLPSYQPPETTRTKIGAAIFLAVWMPLFALARALAEATANADGRGNVPHAVKTIVRCVFFLMWIHHDYLHAPIWGRGDGLGGPPRIEV